MVVFAISAVKTRQMIPSVRDGGEFVVNPITKIVGSRKGFFFGEVPGVGVEQQHFPDTEASVPSS